MNQTGPTARAGVRLFVLLAPLLVLAAGGCAVDENKEMALYRAVLDGETPVRVDYQANAPLSLPQALLLANQHNERLAIGGEDFVQAMADKQRAAANFFPTVSLVPSYSKADGSDDAGNRRVQGGDTQDETALRGSSTATGDGRFDSPVNLNVNLFRGFRDVANVRRSAAEIERTRAALLDLQATVLLDVARAYYQVLRSEGAVRVLENSGELQDARVKEMRTKDLVGAAQKLDVAQIEAQAANTRAQLVAARTEVRNGRLLLAFLTAAPVADAPLEDRLNVPPAVSPADVFLELAFAEREDLRAARAAIEAARQNVEVAFGQFYPSISLNLNYYLTRDSEPSDSDWNALVSLNLPIFTGGRINADHRIALSQARQTKQNESLLRRSIEQDLLTVYENLVAITRQIEELRIAVNAANTALEVSEGRYRAGLGTYLERLIAQDQQLSAQLNLSNAEFNRKILYLNLLRVAGQLSRPRDPLVLTLPEALTSPLGPSGPVTVPTTPPIEGLTAPATQPGSPATTTTTTTAAAPG